jgi:hypothetical protein
MPPTSLTRRCWPTSLGLWKNGAASRTNRKRQCKMKSRKSGISRIEPAILRGQPGKRRRSDQSPASPFRRCQRPHQNHSRRPRRLLLPSHSETNPSLLAHSHRQCRLLLSFRPQTNQSLQSQPPRQWSEPSGHSAAIISFLAQRQSALTPCQGRPSVPIRCPLPLTRAQRLAAGVVAPF